MQRYNSNFVLKFAVFCCQAQQALRRMDKERLAEHEDPDKYYAEEIDRDENEDVPPRKGKGRGRGKGKGRGKSKKGKGKGKERKEKEEATSTSDAAAQPSQDCQEPDGDAAKKGDEVVEAPAEPMQEKPDLPAASPKKPKARRAKTTASPKVAGTKSRGRAILKRAKSLTPKKAVPSGEEPGKDLATEASEVLHAMFDV